MNITSKIQRLYTKEELEGLNKTLAKDKVIVPLLTRLIEDSISELQRPTSPADFEKTSWALERAYRDGGVYHLQQILTIFKEK